MKIYERFKKIADQQNNINTDLKEVRDALLCELGKKDGQEYKGGLMGDNNLKINVLHKAIALLQRDVRNEDFATSGSTSTLGGSRGRTVSSTMSSMASWVGLGGQRQQQSPDGFKIESAV